MSGYTENGDITNISSGNYNLDFFTKITRSSDYVSYIKTFIDAWNESNETAYQILMNLRDIRNGKGEKLIPIVIMTVIKLSVAEDIYQSILEGYIQQGCWKDVLRIYELYCRYSVANQRTVTNKIELVLMAKQLDIDTKSDSVSLCAKWAPSEKSHFDKYPTFAARELGKIMKLKPVQYRKMLTSLRGKINVLEMLMATGQYEKIDFSKIPSVAMMKSSNMFRRDHNSNGQTSEARAKLASDFKTYLDKLVKGTTKVNCVGIQPHELVTRYFDLTVADVLIESQWSEIVKRVKKSGVFRNVTAVVDVSGSMMGDPMSVAIALGILVSDCTEGLSHGKCITFDSNPQWHILTGSNLFDKVACLRKAPWGASTNITRVFELILNHAKLANLSQNEMIDTLFIFTDMQFDKCDSNCSSSIDNAKIKFAESGYTLPKIVCWNLRNSSNVPFSHEDERYAMMSGFSSEMLKYIMTCTEFTPVSIMKKSLEQYVVPELLVGNYYQFTGTVPDLEHHIIASAIKPCPPKDIASVSQTDSSDSEQSYPEQSYSEQSYSEQSSESNSTEESSSFISNIKDVIFNTLMY